MLKKVIYVSTIIGLSVVLSSCDTGLFTPSHDDNSVVGYVGDAPYQAPAITTTRKIGNPYDIAGVKYYPIKSSEGYKERGIASWYGKDFHAKATANGETYDMYALTAAHTTLPLPTYVRVTNLENNKSAIVKVNDRGPFVRGRIIDLSYAAAKKLDMIKNGTAPVLLEALPTDGTALNPLTNDRPMVAQIDHVQPEKESSNFTLSELQNDAQQAQASQNNQLAQQTYPNTNQGISAPIVSGLNNNTSAPIVSGLDRQNMALNNQITDLGTITSPIASKPTNAIDNEINDVVASTSSNYDPTRVYTDKNAGLMDSAELEGGSLKPDELAWEPNAPAVVNPTVEPVQTSNVPLNKTQIFIQTGAFSDYNNAQSERAKLANIFGSAQIAVSQKNNITFYRVRVGAIDSVSKADLALKQLIDMGYGSAYIIVEQANTNGLANSITNSGSN